MIDCQGLMAVSLGPGYRIEVGNKLRLTLTAEDVFEVQNDVAELWVIVIVHPSAQTVNLVIRGSPS